MKKYLLILFSSLLCLSCLAQTSNLKFRDGKFKIVQFTDLHWVESDSYKQKNDSTYNLMREIIRSERPDLVILTGDVVVPGMLFVAGKDWLVCSRKRKCRLLLRSGIMMKKLI